jgi:hypothetical protein
LYHSPGADELERAVRAIPDLGEGEDSTPPTWASIRCGGKMQGDGACTQGSEVDLCFANLENLGDIIGHVVGEAVGGVGDVLRCS